ncbi:MAG: peptide chain release factor N(5)-glutamine methyltransferase [Firmicutes bacterium]|nr:peptide chain release factor N(5)-glutamine methyltransferase [Bacillota bacterium]
MPTIRDVYNEMIASHSHAVEEMTIRILLAEVNGIETMSELYIAMNKPMKGLDQFRRLFARVINGEPVQYVLQKTTFCGIPLFIDERVLIPRPETEELVEKITKIIRQNYSQENLVIADIGTGSGCIAFALEKEFPKSKIFGTDISYDALEVAKMNAKKLHSNVSFFEGDLLLPLVEKNITLDVLISNPPYIENSSDVDSNVFNYEPHGALFAPHGIDFYENIIKTCSLVLHKGSTIFFEINYDQEERLKNMLEETLAGSKAKFIKDLQGKTRFLYLVYNPQNAKIIK